MWCFAGELLAKFPPEWWSKEKTPNACAKIHAQRVIGALTIARDGQGCYNKPHLWPAAVLTE